MTFDQLLIQIKSVPYYSNLAAFSSSTAELYMLSLVHTTWF